MAGETAAGDVSERMLFAPTTDAESLVPVQPPVALSPASRRFSLPALPDGLFPKALLPASTASLQFMSRTWGRDIALEIDRGAAFLLVPVFLAFGAIVYFALPFEPAFAPALGGTLAIGLVLALLPSRGVTHFALAAVLVCLLGFLAAKVETWRAGTKMLGGEISTVVTGRVAAIDHLANGRTRLTLDVTATARPKLRYAPDRIRASAVKIPAGLAVGAEVTGLVRLMPPSGPVRPQSYDFSFESYFDRIGASGFFLRTPQLTTAAAPQPAGTEKVRQNNQLLNDLYVLKPHLPFSARISAWVQNGRNAIADRIRESIGGPEGEIAAALVVGVRAGIPEVVNESLRRTGLYHVISISGLHMALVAGTIMGGLRVGFALFPGFASRRPVKKYAAVAALAAIAAYLFISGGEVAAQRSFIMLAVMLTALLFDRAALSMRNLAISAILVIVISPHEVVGPSFQMSFAATAALVGAYAWWSDRRQANSNTTARPPARSPARNMLRKVLVLAVGLAATSVVAGLATAVFGAYHFQRVSPLSLVANLAAMPIVSVLVMPFAVMGAAAMPFGLDAPFFYIMGRGLSAMIVVADWFSVRSPLDAVGLVSVQAVLLIAIALVFATMATTRLRLAALPFAVLGALALVGAKTPDVFVSEDGRLVALRNGEGELAVNRARPNQFTIDSWKRALRAETIVPPEKSADSRVQYSEEPASSGSYAAASLLGTLVANASEADEPSLKPASQPAETSPPSKSIPGTRFDCDPERCVIRHPSGQIIVHTANAAAARSACDYASLIIIDDATAELSCKSPAVAIVTKRDLARHGSAAIHFAAQGSKPEIRYAVAKPYRPWHAQRQFSRAARGMPPYLRKPTPEAKTPPNQPEDAAAGESPQ
ncbi:ComEC/Rec2 family competence protein [Mesorhizobium sp. WSM2239]|uniref:ComEC/Rec2 family competence protein n=2 Tax=unclassified Mesorhizobium TaxID=325217 RepID=A0AAU8D6K6_9HYPH